MFPGESPQSTAIRKAREEAGLEILPNQLQWIGAYSTEFAERSQPPAEEGLHSVNLTFAVRLTAAQAAQVQLSEDEYSEWAWVRSSALPQWVTGNGPMDEALLAIGRAYDRLGSNLMGHGSIELDSDQDRSDERPD
jgi:ADP-ribose pyrophosphatase YjhB (NUDIX family)